MIQTQHNFERRRSTESSGTQQFSLHTVIVALRCWWMYAAPLGLLLAAGAGFAVYYLVNPTYTATAWLIIRDRPELLLKSVSQEDPRRFVQNQIELMRSPSIIEPVAGIPAVASTPELSGTGDPAQALKRLAKIRPVGQSEFYVIEFTSVSATKAALVANELANKFLDLHSRDESERTTNTVAVLKQRLTEQEAVVKNLRDVVQTLAIQRNGKNPFDTRPKEELFQVRSPLAELQSQLIAAEIDSALLNAQVQVDTELLEKQSLDVPEREIERFVDSHPRLAGLRTRLEQFRAKLQEHEHKSQDLERNALYQQLKRQVSEDGASVDKLIDELRTSGREELIRQVRQARDDQIGTLKRKQANAEFTVQILKEKFDGQFKNQKEYTGDSLQLEFLRADYDRATAIYNAISDRILSIEMELKAPVRVKLHREAPRPVSPDEALPFKKMLMAALGAFFLPFGLAVGIEHVFRRVASRAQIESEGRITVVGEITVLPRRTPQNIRRTRKPNRDLQLFQETVDGLRTYLTLDQSLQGMKTLAVTSAVSGEGKTSLAVQLAMSVASATGEPTLLIDGDMRSPDIHRVFDVKRSPGLAEVLQGKCLVEDALQTDVSRAVHLLAAGSLEVNPHRLLGNGTFEELIRKLRETYAYIVIDTPPVLSASESLVMARVADVALLCVRRDFSRVRQVADAFKRLHTAGANMAGAVLSGIPTHNYTYRYGSYYFDRSAADATNSKETEA